MPLHYSAYFSSCLANVLLFLPVSNSRNHVVIILQRTPSKGLGVKTDEKTVDSPKSDCKVKRSREISQLMDLPYSSVLHCRLRSHTKSDTTAIASQHPDNLQPSPERTKGRQN